MTSSRYILSEATFEAAGFSLNVSILDRNREWQSILPLSAAKHSQDSRMRRAVMICAGAAWRALRCAGKAHGPAAHRKGQPGC